MNPWVAKFPWTDEAIAMLQSLYAAGHAFSVIGAKLGCSRNAAIGKSKRLGLPPRGPDNLASAHYAKRKRKPKPFNFARLSAKAPPSSARRANGGKSKAVIPPANLLPPLNIHLMDTKPGQCRFIAGEDALCCGHPVWPESSYCAPHYALTHVRES